MSGEKMGANKSDRDGHVDAGFWSQEKPHFQVGQLPNANRLLEKEAAGG